MPTLPINTIICGDALTQLQTLPDECIQCCVTSPPLLSFALVPARRSS